MVGVGRDLCGSPSPTPCRRRVTQSRLHRTLSRRVWNISREGDSTTSPGSLFQCSVTLIGKGFSHPAALRRRSAGDLEPMPVVSREEGLTDTSKDSQTHPRTHRHIQGLTDTSVTSAEKSTWPWREAAAVWGCQGRKALEGWITKVCLAR